MTRDEARAYFKDKGLTYDNITLPNLHFLVELLDKHFLKQREELIRSGKRGWLYWLKVNRSKYYRGEYTFNTEEYKRVICAYITASGEYFMRREAISFNRDGFIGFCGDADDENAQPVLEAFVEWCDWMAGGEPDKWAWISDDDVMCPRCGTVFNTNDNADAGIRWKFCPECGRPMKNEGEHHERNIQS